MTPTSVAVSMVRKQILRGGNRRVLFLLFSPAFICIVFKGIFRIFLSFASFQSFKNITFTCMFLTERSAAVYRNQIKWLSVIDAPIPPFLLEAFEGFAFASERW